MKQALGMQQAVVQTQFSLIHQNPNETANDYINRFERACVIRNLFNPVQLTYTEKITSLRQGLQPYLLQPILTTNYTMDAAGYTLLKNNIRTIESTLASVQQFQTIQTAVNGKSYNSNPFANPFLGNNQFGQPVVNAVITPPVVSPQQNEINELKSMVTQLVAAQSNNNNNYRGGYRGGRGNRNFLRNSGNRGGFQNNNNNYNNRGGYHGYSNYNNSGYQAPVCFHCGKVGHTVPQCRNRDKPPVNERYLQSLVDKKKDEGKANTRLVYGDKKPLEKNSIIIKGKVEENDMTFVLDTGSENSLIDLHDLQQLKNMSIRKTEGIPKLYSVSGHQLNVIGVTELEIDFAGKKILHEFIVLNEMKSKPLLGEKFRKLNKVNVYHNNKLSIDGHEIDYVENEIPEDLTDYYNVMSETVIKPMSRNLIVCSLTDKEGKKVENVDKDKLLLIQRGINFGHQFIIPDGMNEVKDGKFTMEIVSLSRKTIELKGIKLTKAELVDKNSITLEAEKVSEKDKVKRVLSDLNFKLGKNLSEKQKSEVMKVLEKYQRILAADDDQPLITNVMNFDIDVGEADSIRQVPYRHSPLVMKEITEQVQKLEKQGIITKSNSEWLSPCLLVGKKDGKKRLVIDYRKVNDVTKKDAFPLQDSQLILSAMKGSKYFTKLDLLAGFHQIPINERSKAITAFGAPSGQY